jgi:rhodanese-related sulfurtransferase
MRTFKKLIITTIAPLLISFAAFAAPLIQTAPDVAQQVNAGEMVLLDIRSRGEWQETGIAAGAWPVSMHEPDFGLKLEKIMMLYKPEQIAIICATGGRTQYIQKTLDGLGIKGITDLSEGMMGNKSGPGWLARKMPVITLEQSQANFDTKFATK